MLASRSRTRPSADGKSHRGATEKRQARPARASKQLDLCARTMRGPGLASAPPAHARYRCGFPGCWKRYASTDGALRTALASPRAPNGPRLAPPHNGPSTQPAPFLDGGPLPHRPSNQMWSRPRVRPPTQYAQATSWGEVTSTHAMRLQGQAHTRHDDASYHACCRRCWQWASTPCIRRARAITQM